MYYEYIVIINIVYSIVKVEIKILLILQFY